MWCHAYNLARVCGLHVKIHSREQVLPSRKVVVMVAWCKRSQSHGLRVRERLSCCTTVVNSLDPPSHTKRGKRTLFNRESDERNLHVAFCVGASQSDPGGEFNSID